MKRIEDGRTVYNRDRQYVQKRFRQLRKDLFGGPEEPPEVIPESVPESISEPPAPRQTSKGRSNNVWYVLAIILGMLIVVVAYLLLRKRGRGNVYKTLCLWFGLAMLLLAPELLMNGFDELVSCLRTGC